MCVCAHTAHTHCTHTTVYALRPLQSMRANQSLRAQPIMVSPSSLKQISQTLNPPLYVQPETF